MRCICNRLFHLTSNSTEAEAPPLSSTVTVCLPLERGRGVFITRQGAGSTETAAAKSVCIAFTGSLYPQALSAAQILESRGIKADLYNLRFLKPVDEDYLTDIMNQYELTIFVEEGSRAGGFGEFASGLALRRNCSSGVLVLGVDEKFDALGNREELLRRNGLDGESIANAVEKIY